MSALAVMVAGCSLLGGAAVPNANAPEDRYFELAFGGGGGAAVPVQVADVTESITSAEIDARNPPLGGLDQTFLAPVPGRPDALLVGWPGGTCEERADLALERGDVRPAFTLKLLPRPQGCHGIDLPRRLIVSFERPVNVNDFDFHIVQ
jgi:hypothetical protein